VDVGEADDVRRTGDARVSPPAIEPRKSSVTELETNTKRLRRFM